MKNLIAIRKPHLAYNLLLFVISFSFLIVWLPLLRSVFDGESYQWGNSYFGIFLSGKGVTLSWLFLLAQFFFYIPLFLSLYWFKDRLITFALLGVWWVLFFGNMLFSVFTDPSASFRGDTMGIVVPLIYIVLPLALVAVALLLWVYRIDIKSEEVKIPWNRKNKLLAWIILGPLPVQWLLLHFGPHPSTMDQVGVVITILQCLLIALIVRPYWVKNTD